MILNLLVRGVIICLPITFLAPTLGMAANGSHHPSIRQVRSPGGGCVCLPNARNFGYFTPRWRPWPNEHRPDKTFPESIGRESIPTPSGSPISRSGRENTPDTRGKKEYLLPTLPEMSEDTFPKDQKVILDDGLPTEPLPSIKPESGYVLPGLPGLSESPGQSTPTVPMRQVVPNVPSTDGGMLGPMSTEGSPFQSETLQGVPVEGGLPILGPSPNDGSLRERRYLDPASNSLPEAYRSARTQNTPPYFQPPTIIPEPRTSEPNKPPVFPPLRDVVRADWSSSRDSSSAWPKVQNKIPVTSPTTPTSQAGYQTVQDNHLGSVGMAPVIHPEPTPRSANQPSKPESQPNPYRPGLKGFCPVELMEKQLWSEGDPRYAAVYRNRAYFLLGPDQQKQFLANPDRYCPVMEGFDPVLAIDENRQVAGSVDYCVDYDGRLYLFSGGYTLARFRQNPSHYAKQSLQ